MITQLKASNFRNFATISLDLHPRLNLIVGENGSGKTNLLEAIYHLSLGKSFRTPLSHRLIQVGQPSAQVFGLLKKNQLLIPVGIERHRTQGPVIHINYAPIASIAELSQQFPVRIINPDSFSLISGGPKYRRQLLNWGCFYQEAAFWESWKKWSSLLKQRNAALKQGANSSQLSVWDNLLQHTGEVVSQAQFQYIQQLKPVFQSILGLFLPHLDLQMKFYRGWEKGKTLAQALNEGFSRDSTRGFTHSGPHRADVRFRLNMIPAKDVLSRGQQKCVVCALALAQGLLLKQITNFPCTFLLDDLAAELDSKNLSLIYDYLQTLNTQVFVTSLTSQKFAHDDFAMFHVEHGEFTQN